MTTTEEDNTTCHSLLSGISQTFSPQLLHRIQTSCRILLVGSGGIGCELLKNLALSGFRQIEIIDLDTIDVSNLNRQFLFRSHHVGMPKCTVASEVAKGMLPLKDGEECGYNPHMGNVCDTSKFTVPYISSFDLVLNALDNITARRRVNRLCLAADTPLVEAGTTGYVGQVTVIDKPSNVECYECQAKPTQKVYPICTIRSTPSMPVHTIVWAKELWKLIFGGRVEESMLFEDEEIGQEEEEEDTNKNKSKEKEGDKEEKEKEKSTYMDHIMSLRSLLFDSATTSTQDQIFEATIKCLHALYGLEIQKQIDMDRYKSASTLPTPLSLSQITESCNQTKDGTAVAPSKESSFDQNAIWSTSQNLLEFLSCIFDAHALLSSPSTKKLLLPEFDKDDDLSMRFITAASNLRSVVFSINPIQSYYGAKGIAGNIVPAIATTNAIVAGLQVLQVFHILKRQMEIEDQKKNDESKKEEEGGVARDCRYIYCLRDKTRKGYYLQPTSLPPPNPQCFVCRNATISTTLNTKMWTMKQLLTRLLKKELGFESPTILIGDDIVHEEGEGADEETYKGNLEKLLVDLPCGGIKDGSIVRVEDFTQDLEVDLCFVHKENWEEEEKEEEGEKEETERFMIGGEKPQARKEEEKEDNGKKKDNGNDKKEVTEKKDDDDDDDIEIVDSPSKNKEKKAEKEEEDDNDDVIEIVEAPTKKTDSTENEAPASKKRKHDNNDDDDAKENEETATKKSKVEKENGHNGDSAKKNEVEVIELD